MLNDPDEPGSLGARWRARRWQVLLEHFPDLADMRVLDLGGTWQHWSSAPVRPASLVLLNTAPTPGGDGWAVEVQGDACDPPGWLRTSPFDLVHSNSVIEHVGGHARRCAMAEVVHELAPHHWVQTPYRYFPLEPHWLFPGLQFLPLALRVRAANRWPLAWSRAPGAAGVGGVLDVELLSRTEMRFYFPDSVLLDERAGGITKSLVAVR